MTADFDTIRAGIGEPAIEAVQPDGTIYVYTTNVQRNQQKKDALAALSCVEAAAEQAEKALVEIAGHSYDDPPGSGRVKIPQDVRNIALAALAVLRDTKEGTA